MFILTYTAALLATAFAMAAVVFLFRLRAVDGALGFYLLSAAIWIGANAAADVSYTPFALTLTSQFAFFGGIVNLFSVIFLIDLIVDQNYPSVQRVASYGIPCLILSLFGFSSYGIVGLSFPFNEPAEILPGPIYSVALAFYLFGLGYGAFRLIRSLRRGGSYTRRMQLLYVLISLLVVMFAQMFFDVLLPLLGEERFYDLGPLMSIVFAVGCGYAIARHQLLDIRVVVQKSLIYSFMLGCIIFVYISLAVLLNVFVRSSAASDVFWSGGITILIGIFGTPVIERYFRRISDPFFFKETYDYPEAMRQLTLISQTARDFDTLIARMEEKLSELLRATRVQIILLTEESNTSFEAEDTPPLSIPILLEEELIGHILVGKKKSGERYTDTDENLLTTFAFQAATALSRVRLYKEVQKHAEELEQKVESRTNTLRALQEEQRKMLIDLSHNLQTPLTIFQTKIAQLRKKLPLDEDIHHMEESILSLSDFIYDLLALSSLERTLEEEDLTPVSMSALMEEIAEEMTIITADQGILITSHVARDVMIIGNKKRLREVVLNLAHNAVKYIGDGTKTLSFSLETKDSHAVITIADTGIGISEIDLAHIFERFYRAEHPATSHIRGNGLGLSIVQQILRRHSGVISVESTLDRDSTFTFTIPLSLS